MAFIITEPAVYFTDVLLQCFADTLMVKYEG